MTEIKHLGRSFHTICDQELSDIYTMELIKWQSFINGPQFKIVPRDRVEQARRYIQALKLEMLKRKLLN